MGPGLYIGNYKGNGIGAIGSSIPRDALKRQPLTFDGTNDIAKKSLLGVTKFNFGTSPFSICGWIKIASLPAGGNNGTVFSIYKDTGGGNIKLIRIVVTPAGALLIFIGDTNGSKTINFQTTGVLSLNTDYHFCVNRIDDLHVAASYEILINKVKVATTTVSLTGTVADFNNFDVATAGIMAIGGYSSSSDIWFFSGAIYNIQIYKGISLSSLDSRSITTNKNGIIRPYRREYLSGYYNNMDKAFVKDSSKNPFDLQSFNMN